MRLDFGNGLIAGGTARDAIRIVDFVGLDVPMADVTFEEHGVLDGGRFVANRIRSRAMAVTMTTTAYTRHQIAAAFRYGQQFTISSELGSMPYYVEGLTFATANQRGPVRFTVALRSPDAYPVAESHVVTGGSTSAMAWPHEYPHTYDTVLPVSSLTIDIAASLPYLPAEPVITLTAVATGTLVVTHPGGTFSVDVTTGQVVVIDSSARYVSVGGTSAMADFDRSSVWPVLYAGSNTLSFSQTVPVSVKFDARIVGLI